MRGSLIRAVVCLVGRLGPRLGIAPSGWFEEGCVRGSEANAVVNFQAVVNQRFQESWRGFLGSGSNRRPGTAEGRRLRRTGPPGPRLRHAHQPDHEPDAAGAGYSGGDSVSAAHGRQAGTGTGASRTAHLRRARLGDAAGGGRARWLAPGQRDGRSYARIS